MTPQPPRPAPQPTDRTLWGETVTDPHAWLRDAESPDVRAHLEAENAYVDAVLAPTEALQGRLFDEIKARVQETDLSVPVRKDGWIYYARTEEGKDYGMHFRRPLAEDEPLLLEPPADELEQCVLDENVEAGDDDYFEIGVFEISPDHRWLLWGADREGDERFDLVLRPLDGQAGLDEVIPGVTYGSAWATDNETFFYLRADDANRPHEVWRHRIGTDPADDVRVFHEPDERFFCSVGRDKDDTFVHIGVSSAVTDETWLVPAAEPTAEPRRFAERRQGVEYSIGHFDGRFLVLTNDRGATNFRLCEAPLDATGPDDWTELIAERPDVMLTGFDVFRTHLALFERADGVTRVSLAPWDGVAADGLAAFTPLPTPEPVATVWAGANTSLDDPAFRYGYSSMVTPASVRVHDLATGDDTVLKQQPVLGDFDPARYRTWREWATAPDGTRVPVSCVARVDRDDLLAAAGIDGPGPALLYAYGAYEASMDPTFSTIRLLLLDRGFVFALAHPRGGGEMGRRWYEDGKFERKVNTFGDTEAAARHLIDAGLTQPSRLALRGGSAGGLLVGAVLNRAPELFGAAVAEVPFVDVISTMSDATLPLTVTEWEEWGNPVDDEAIYRVMRTYAPLENVADRPYPAIYATGGLSDPRVGFWEPAKWVLALREHTTTDRPVLLRTELGAGHFGPSGRYAGWRDEARTLAFVLWALGCDGIDPA